MDVPFALQIHIWLPLQKSFPEGVHVPVGVGVGVAVGVGFGAAVGVPSGVAVGDGNNPELEAVKAGFSLA